MSLFMVLFPILLLCLTVSTSSSLKLFMERLEDPSGKDAIFPILDAYHPPYLNEPPKTIAYLLSAINHTISHFTEFYRILVLRREENDAYKMKMMDEYFRAMWQLFIPGSIITDHEFEEYEDLAVVDQRINLGNPIKKGELVLRYLSKRNPLEFKVHKLNPPSGTIVSYQIRKNCFEKLYSGANEFTFLHIFDVRPFLNQILIKAIMDLCVFKMHEGVVKLDKAAILKDHKYIELRRVIFIAPIPGIFPITALEKQVKIGIIPRLSKYIPDNNVLPPHHFIQMIKKMVAVIIQQRIGMIHSSTSISTFINCFQEEFQKFCPNALVLDQPHYSDVIHPYDIIMPHSNDKSIEIVIDSRVDKNCVGSTRVIPQHRLIVISLPRVTPPVLIKNFLNIQTLIYPNLIPLKPRRFACFSTKVYNAASGLNPSGAALLNYRGIIHEYLELYLMHNGSIPREIMGRFKHLRIYSVPAPMLKYASLTCLTGTVMEAQSIIAYDKLALYRTSIPVIIFKELDGEVRLVTARHVDENASTNERIVNQILY